MNNLKDSCEKSVKLMVIRHVQGYALNQKVTKAYQMTCYLSIWSEALGGRYELISQEDEQVLGGAEVTVAVEKLVDVALRQRMSECRVVAG